MGRPKPDEDEYKFSENAIEWLSGERKATVTFSQKKWIGVLHELTKNPKCEVIAINTDGSITARVPIEWLRLEPKERG